MNEQRYPGRLAAAVLVSSALGCVLIASILVWLRPPRFDTHQEAVGYVLAQHGIAYERIRISYTWPDTLDRRSYSADVFVLFASGKEVAGRIECASGRSSCYVRLPRLGIPHEPVPELTTTPPWQRWLQQNLPRFALPGG